MYTARINGTDGSVRTVKLESETKGNIVSLTMPAFVAAETESIDFAPDFFTAATGDEGYFVLPQSRNEEDSMLVLFRDREEGTLYEGDNPCLPIFGARHPEKNFLAVVTGMPYAFHLVAGVLGGVYFCYPRFTVAREKIYEPISVEYHILPYEETDYNAIAREYRKYLLDNNLCTPIAKRENEVLKYAKESLYVRVRQAWKPVPSPVAHQSRENEPPLHVACDFDRVAALMDAFAARGIDKAEFCLVGWNIKGHDGRWPETFPVEPSLGGEEKLRALIAHAKELGYQITCHTNSNSAYDIADGFTPDWLRRDADGNTTDSHFLWAGGLENELCPKVAWEQAQKILPRVAQLGFHGLHYVDVIGLLAPKECYSAAHPLTKGETAQYYARIARLSRDLFGGFSSEGARGHLAGETDFGLYISYFPFKEPEKRHPLADELIPLWQLVYHGIVLSNPYTDTVNAPVKGRENVLKLYERGGRPALYYYSKFVTENEGALNNWMGDSDFICDTDEDLALSADRAATLYREYKEMAYLQSLFMEKHEKLVEGVYAVTYSDGSVVTVDYNAGTVTLTKA